MENLTACNFLSGSGEGGNQIWFNGGDGSGQIGMGPFGGDFLSATSTFYGGSDAPAGTYGIFTSNSRGPGVIDHSYASNMNDASYYIGACPDCNQVLSHAHAEGSALGYSGTNSGGHLVIENSEWDLNNTGIVTNSQNNDDAPSPQVGLCPGSATQSCTIFRNNFIHDNNNPNVPMAGSASFGPPGPASSSPAVASTRSPRTGSPTTVPGGSCSRRTRMTPRTRSTRRRTARAGPSTSSSPATTTTGATRSPTTR